MSLPIRHHFGAGFDELYGVEVRIVGFVFADSGDDMAERQINAIVGVAMLLRPRREGGAKAVYGRLRCIFRNESDVCSLGIEAVDSLGEIIDNGSMTAPLAKPSIRASERPAV